MKHTYNYQIVSGSISCEVDQDVGDVLSKERAIYYRILYCVIRHVFFLLDKQRRGNEG